MNGLDKLREVYAMIVEYAVDKISVPRAFKVYDDYKADMDYHISCTM